MKQYGQMKLKIMNMKLTLTAFTLLLGLGILNSAYAKNSPTLETSREIFLQAEKALAQNKKAQYQSLKKQLVSYPLLPYLIYAEFDQKFSAITPTQFQNFMDQYPDSPLAEQLRTRWLNLKARQEDWKAFAKAYHPTEDLSLQCYNLWAGLQTHANRSIILKQVTPIWMSGKATPKSCEAVFNVWEKSELMSRPLVWQRTKSLIQEGNDSLARKMTKYLKPSEKALVELWLMVRSNPYLVTHRKYFTSQHPANLEMIVDGVSLIAKEKPDTAIKIWQQIAHQYPFEERHWGLVVRAIGLAYAFQRHPDAEKWLTKVPTIHANQQVHEWRVRVALSKEDWPKVLRWTKALPEALARTEEWQYWHARALEMTNHRDTSQAILTKLAKTRSYYGFLASQNVLKPYAILNHKAPIEQSLLQAMNHRMSIQRARELQLLGRTAKARTEWQYTTKKMSDKEKHAAAHIALKWNLPNWAMLALSKANNKDDLSLRFPVVYTQHILQEAERHKIDPAWILAITRQESAFVPHAKSSAGAIGLMQLIPSTAHMVAKRKKLPFAGHHTLLEPYTNIQLGSGYLKMMLDQHSNNAVLATAAYNAGPGRIQKWLPTFDMAADLWIETIPFKETREYVKNVLTSTAIYQEILGHRPQLARHMSYIPRK